MNCKECNQPNDAAARFCCNCGATLEAPLTCAACGKTYPAGTKFCPDDGTKLGELTCPACGKKYPAGTRFCPEDGSSLGGSPAQKVQSVPVQQPAQSAAEANWENCGNSNVKWRFDKDYGTLTIGGSGAMPDFNLKDGNKPPWFKYKKTIKKLVVQDGVSTIGNEAFIECKNLTEATIADSVERIGENAFLQCESLNAISSKAKTIGKCAFEKCANLKKANFELAETIGNSAFEKCTNLTEVNFELVETIEKGVFTGCSNLKTVTMNSVKTIGDYAFQGCSNLAEANFEIVEKIGEAAFQDCRNLSAISMEYSVKTIGESAFMNCTSLSKIELYAIEKMEKMAFAGSKNLRKAILGEDYREQWRQHDNNNQVFWGCHDSLEITTERSPRAREEGEREWAEKLERAKQEDESQRIWLEGALAEQESKMYQEIDEERERLKEAEAAAAEAAAERERLIQSSPSSPSASESASSSFVTKKYTASRISDGNKLFPPTITVEKNGLTVKLPGLFSGSEKFVSFKDISSISYDAPMVGFTKLQLNIHGAKTTVEGFYKDDCKAILNAWKNR